MGTILLIIVGIVVVMGIIGLALTVAKAGLASLLGIAALALSLVWNFPIVSILLVGGIIYSGDIIIPILIYAVVIVLLAREKAAKEIKNKVLQRIEEEGIVSSNLAERMPPVADKAISWLTLAVYEKGYGKKVLDQEAANKKLVFDTYDGRSYYFYKTKWDDFASMVMSQATATINNHMEKDGLISEAMTFDIDNHNLDLSELVHSYLKDAFVEYVRKSLEERDLIAEKVKGKGNVKLFIDKTVLAKKREQLQGKVIIEGNDFVRLIGERDLAEQRAVMHVFSILWKDMTYELITRDTDHFWIRANEVKSHTCDGCKEVYRILTRYGKNQYCKPCMMKVHAQEDADEAEGKAVKRYISAPPPGVKIKI